MEKSSEGSNGGTRCTVNAFNAGDDPLVRVAAEIPSSKETVLIAGFLGSGLVGSIAVQYLVESLSFTHIGDIVSPLSACRLSRDSRPCSGSSTSL